MALFSDGSIIGLDDLAGYEGSLLETASAEGIDVTRKLALAKDEVMLELASALTRSGESERVLPQVVFTPALRSWYLFHTLAVTYREAYHGQLNDRFKGKWHEYRDLAKWASQLLYEIGVGLNADPVPEAEQPVVSMAAGSMDPGTYFVRVSWVNVAGEEGLASLPVMIDVLSDQGLEVRCGELPANVAGFHVYVGATPDGTVRQTTNFVERAAAWTCDGVAKTEGAAPGYGQQATHYRQMQRILMRG